jgi:hypothetical protein
MTEQDPFVDTPDGPPVWAPTVIITVKSRASS